LVAVKKFQSAKGLTADGEAGAETFSALCAA
jgi:murein L,D-transpeptidase YcbB/YkuD